MGAKLNLEQRERELQGKRGMDASGYHTDRHRKRVRNTAALPSDTDDDTIYELKQGACPSIKEAILRLRGLSYSIAALDDDVHSVITNIVANIQLTPTVAPPPGLADFLSSYCIALMHLDHADKVPPLLKVMQAVLSSKLNSENIPCDEDKDYFKTPVDSSMSRDIDSSTSRDVDSCSNHESELLVLQQWRQVRKQVENNFQSEAIRHFNGFVQVY